MTERRASRLIMVTSARPGEGKTFTALNLALAFASERSVKALLVDVDTQHSTVPEILGIDRKKGIVDVLAGNLELPEVLIQTNIPNLMILPAGRGGPHVPELLSSPEMAGLLDEMTQRLPDHYLIIDTPPCMASSDAAALAPLSDKSCSSSKRTILSRERSKPHSARWAPVPDQPFAEQER